MKEVGFLQNFAMSVVFQESHIGRFTLGLFFLSLYNVFEAHKVVRTAGLSQQ